VRWLERFFCLFWPHKDIARGGDLYLRRFYLTPLWFPIRLFLHHIVRPDSDEHMHDHPWDFWTFPVMGGYLENGHRPRRGDVIGIHWLLKLVGTDPEMGIRHGGWQFRPSTYRHRIVAVFPNTWTLVATRKAVREWGFWVKDKFVPWFQYLNVPNVTAKEDRLG